jgi:hypothetical protein
MVSFIAAEHSAWQLNCIPYEQGVFLIHLFESVLNGVVLFAGPLVVVAAMAGLLTLIDRLYCALWETRPDKQCHGLRNVSTSFLVVLNHATPYCPNWVKSLSSLLGPAEISRIKALKGATAKEKKIPLSAAA